jgi:hypothetical protein
MIAMYDGLSTDAGSLIPHPMGFVIFSVVAHTGLFPASGLATVELQKIFVKPGKQGVVAVGRRAGSGTRLTFIKKVLGLDPGMADLTPDMGNCPPPTEGTTSFTSCTEDSTAHLLDFVSGTPNAIGYAEAYGLLGGPSRISAINIDGFAPTRENVLNGKYHFWAVEHLYAAMHPTALAEDFIVFLPQYIKLNPLPDFIACSDAPNTLKTDCHAAIPPSPNPSPSSSPLKKSGNSFDDLSIGSLVTLGILIIYAFMVAFYWRLRPRAVKRPWRQWFGWGLALVAAVWASLWSAYFLGSVALGWVVPSLVAIGASSFGYWYKRRDSNVTSHRLSSPGSAPVISRQIVTDLGKDLTIAHLGKVITIVSDKLREKSQIDSIVSESNLGRVRYPTGRAGSRELWITVFETALDEPRGTLDLLLHNIRGSLGTLSGRAFEDALSEVGLSYRSSDQESTESTSESILTSGRTVVAIEIQIGTQIYSEDDWAGPLIEASIREMLGKLGAQSFIVSEVIISSWYSSVTAIFRQASDSNAGATSKRAIEVQVLERFQASVDSVSGNTVANLIPALNGTRRAVIQIGSILLVKVDDTVVVRQLSPREMLHWREHPGLFKDPASALVELQRANNASDAEASIYAEELPEISADE